MNVFGHDDIAEQLKTMCIPGIVDTIGDNLTHRVVGQQRYLPLKTKRHEPCSTVMIEMS